MADRDDFKHDSLQDTESVVRYLKAMIDGFEKGHLEFTTDDQSLELEPQGLLELEVRAKRRGGRVKVSLKFSWREEPEETRERSNGLKISAD